MIPVKTYLTKSQFFDFLSQDDENDADCYIYLAISLNPEFKERELIPIPTKTLKFIVETAGYSDQIKVYIDDDGDLILVP